HRKLRVLASREGGARPAARGHAVELGDAALGGLPHRAGDLVGDSVLVRPNRMDPTDLGEDWGEGRRERSMTARSRRIGVAMLRAIDDGLPGSAMPAWRGRLSDAERRDVLAYLKTFSSFFTDTSQHVVALAFGSEPGGGTNAEALKTGRQFFDSIGCRKCHGDQ